MTEFEKKLMLTRDEYDYLMENFGYESPLSPKPIVKQVNYYFDTDDLAMHRQNITCRIRFKDGEYVGTMKSHNADDAYSTETPIDVRHGLQDNSFAGMGLKLRGELTTYRCIILKDAHCEVVLDKNEYLDTTDYELEIEYFPEYAKDALGVYRVFLDLLTRRKCALVYQERSAKEAIVPSKSNRFFERRTALDSVSQTQETKSVNGHAVNDKEYGLSSDTPSYHNYWEKADYSDPDDYMGDYYGAFMAEEMASMSCAHLNGARPIDTTKK